MHREVDAARQERGLDLLAEQALATEFGERPVDHPIAGRPDRHDLERAERRQLRMRILQRATGQRRLDARQRRAAGADAQSGRHDRDLVIAGAADYVLASCPKLPARPDRPWCSASSPAATRPRPPWSTAS